ncbi:DNA-binding XRE family transcriptional regulator [Bacillus pakistanensis]|uniref:DNA-binding XRE family transcriptional regulator n=2 Tax=Rossellomorea pakistanensis TaxID=992288 RepID=A0ABS2NDH2_9BACI|nr:DNA-binding XRE family transcriptional regulator [Bacillus pakistanensis]
MENKIKQYLIENGIKQNFIAEKVNISSGAISLIVRGKSIPELPTAIRLARALNTTVEDLWGDYVDHEVMDFDKDS